MVKMNFARGSRTIFGQKTNETKVKDIIKSIMEPEVDTKVGKAIELGNRIIYPIIQTMVIKNENQAFLTVEIFPIALVIEETGERYVVSLTNDEINSEELIGRITPKK